MARKTTPQPGLASGGETQDELTRPTLDQETVLENKISSELGKFHENEIVTKKLSITQVNSVLESLARNKGISTGSAIRAAAAIFRKGGAAARAKDTLSVEVSCPTTKTTVTIQKYDIAMALNGVAEHTVVRKLAEAMAPLMLEGSLNLLASNPEIDHKGDLASKINRKLVGMKDPINHPPLTREEEICCCTFAQWMPNLNELAGSTRLRSLMELDLVGRLGNNPERKKGFGNSSKNPAKQKQKNAVNAAKNSAKKSKKGKGNS